MRRTKGRLVVIEGPDGVGKSSVCSALSEHLRRGDTNIVELSFPGKVPGTLGELVYRVHHSSDTGASATMSVLARQALHVAAHIDCIDREITPALGKGKTVILDRYWWSAWVYGLVGGCEPRKLQALLDAEREAWAGIEPTLLVLLRRKSPINRDDPMRRWRRLRSEYARLAKQEMQTQTVSVIENSTTIPAVVDKIAAALKTAGKSAQYLERQLSTPKQSSRVKP